MKPGTLHDFLHSNIFYGLVTVFAAWLVVQLRDVLFIIFIAFLVTIALLPLVRTLRRWKVPRSIIVILLLLLLVAAIAGLAYLAIPAFAHQFGQLANRLSGYLDKLGPFAQRQHINLTQNLQGYITNAGHSLLSISAAAFGVVGAVLSIVVMSLYWVLDYDHIKQSGVSGLSKNSQRIVQAIMSNVEKRLGSWLRGQGLMSLIVGGMFLVAYLVIGLPAAFILAVLAGIFEIVPLVGPVLATIPALLIALSISPTKAIEVLVAYVIVHLLEGHVFTPRIVGRSVGLPPLVIIIALLIGASLAGIIGVLMAIPTSLTILSIIEGVREAA